MNGRIANTKWLPSLPARTMSSGDFTFSFLDIQGTRAGKKTWRENQLEKSMEEDG